MILAPYLFGIVLPTKLLENEVNLNVFLKSFVYLGILSGLGGFVTMFFDVNPWSPKGVATSFYGHQNGTSSVYNYTLPAALYFVLFRREVLNKVEKFLFSSGVMIMIIALLYTFSRAGIVSIALILVIASIKYSKKLFYIIIASAPIFFIFLVQGIFTSKGADTALARIGLLAVTIDMLKAKLLWGYGIISTITTFERLKLALNVYDQNNTPHNIILFLILQIGLFAVLPLVLVMISVLWKSTKLIFEKSTDPLLIISYCVCFSMIFKNMFEDLLVYPEFFMYHIFWVFWGFILFFNSGKESKYFPKQF